MKKFEVREIRTVVILADNAAEAGAKAQALFENEFGKKDLPGQVMTGIKILNLDIVLDEY